MKFWVRYLKEKKTTAALYAVTVFLFVATGSLYHLENLGKLSYAALLTLVFWAFAGILGGYRYVRKAERLAAVERHFEQTGELLLREAVGLRGEETELTEAGGGIAAQLERLLCRAEEQLRRERCTYEEKAADGKEYYLMWAHQIKTPISALGLLVEENGDSRVSFRMREELFKIEQYVEMVLTFQRLDSMASDVLLEECGLEALLRQAVKKYSLLFISKGLRVELPSTDSAVLTDQKWFSFCLEQILSNSIKYTESGGIRFEVQEREEDVRLKVADTGIGISEEDLPRIFERGFTGCNGRTDKRATGIGLYLCRRIFDRLGISVQVQSRVGEGTTMDLSVPKRKGLPGGQRRDGFLTKT